jgi:hypothetical protein
MDIILFHIALDEVHPVALAVLALLWLVLVRYDARFRRYGAAWM